VKIVIFSDSHGNQDNMRQVISKERPDAVFHLGDGRADILTVMEGLPHVDLYSVAGNCDWRSRARTELMADMDGVHFLLSHGHNYGVKGGYQTYMTYAHNRRADVALAGHTHEPCLWEDEGLTLLNPGSVGDYFRPTYAIAEVSEGHLTRLEICPVEDPHRHF